VTRNTLRGHRKVLIDSSVWIYHFEQHAEFGVAAGRVIELLEEGAFRGVISELTSLELSVRPSGATAAITNDDGWRVSAPAGIETVLLSDLST